MKKKTFFNIIFFSLFIIACNRGNDFYKVKKITLTGFTQGTTYTIHYFSDEKLITKKIVDSLLQRIDNSVSTYVPNSLISYFNLSNQGGKIDDIFLKNYLLSLQVYKETKGRFNPFAERLFNYWNRFKKFEEQVDSLKVDSLFNFSKPINLVLKQDSLIKKDSRIHINFNAIAQGFSVDYIAQYFKKKQIRDYFIEIGGEVIAKGTNHVIDGWNLAIENPLVSNQSLQSIYGTLILKNKALATSGNYRNFFKTKSGILVNHILDLQTGYPTQNNLLSISVIADSTSIADAYATAFMTMNIESIKAFLDNHKNLKVLAIYNSKNNQIITYMSKNLEFKKK